jgi:hypothetical protein
MSYSSNFNLNQRVSYLESLINNLVPPFPTSSTLAQVLLNGNSAGASDINMNSKDLLLVDNINLVTINGSAYPPVVSADDLQAVLTAGNDSNLSVLLKDNLITPTLTNTISSSAVSITGDGGSGSIGFVVGDVNVNGTASGVISGSVASATTLGLSNSIASSPPFFSPANTNATLTSTPSTASLGFSSGGQFVNAKTMDLTLDGITHTSSTGGDFTISTTDSLLLPSVVAFTNAVAPTCLANPQGSTDLCNKQYVDSQSALTAYQLYFNYSVPYTVPSGSTYQTLSSTQIATPTTVAWTTNSTSPVLLGGFFNLLSTLNITSITAGVWTLLLFANLTSVAGQAREAFFYTIIGTASSGAETILYTSPASLLLNTVAPLIGSVSIQGTIPLISLTGYTGLGIKLYIQSNTASLTTGSVIYQTASAYSSILTSVLPISAITTLDQVLTAGNTATGTYAEITLINTDVGNITNPILTLTNTNATGSVAMECYKNKPTASVNGDVLFTQSVFGKDSGNAKQEFTRINHSVRDVSAGIEDGSIEFGCFVNGAINTFLQINGNENEVNILRTLDMAGNPIRSSTGILNIDSNILMNNSERITLTNTAGTIYNISEQFQINIENITAPTNTYQHLLNTTSHQLRNNQSSVGRAYTNISDATTTNIAEYDMSLAVDIKKLTLETNLVRMNDYNGGTTEQVDITPVSIQFTSSGSASDSLSMYNDSADGGEIEWSNVSGTNGLTITSSHSLTLKATMGATNPLQFDSGVINLLNTNTTTSTPNHNADIHTTSNGVSTNTFLKLQLNGADIWIPYFTSDPSL